ncbi:LOW QUALITY PROTEIN: cyclin-A2-2-like [Argentina anserina]|uniref:LOW QUALITY PROTEIN: cyclin-A2-2-like n=1 Tax=Argentina anserina TaxID=57926 RepID=UPI0021766EE2|nr:LOW QUALITY PROTEIN: cyclin-A2-2-like [Potentilla anserina]
MNKENTNAARAEEPTVRMTRARAKAFGASVEVVSSTQPVVKQGQKRALLANSKAGTSVVSTIGLQHKRRAVLKDVTNPNVDRDDASHVQAVKQAKRGPGKNVKVALNSSVAEDYQDDIKTKLAEELSKIRMAEPREKLEVKEEPLARSMCHDLRQQGGADAMLPRHHPIKLAELQMPQKKEENATCERLRSSNDLPIVNIDKNLKDPLACSLYAPDIYSNLRLTEIERRPSTNYMESLQQDITPSMRGILIDWLVEVSEEYKLVPDTLYLTVNLIDRFLSQNFVQKQKLQLLGVTCMLIASKYEEIVAPRVEEFCLITDNTYSREEVLDMESEVLNFLHFQLSVPTTKTFLRRFIQAAQASYKAPCVELEFLANYLAELTIVEYGFLKFLPSVVAASAVFLARWTLNQSDHPWTPTLEHYTSYKPSDLQTSVIALEELQLNTRGCCLNAICEKYRRQKFKSVATLTSAQKVVHSFEDQQFADSSKRPED